MARNTPKDFKNGCKVRFSRVRLAGIYKRLAARPCHNEERSRENRANIARERSSLLHVIVWSGY